MKRKNHPGRRKPKHHLSAAERHAWRQEGYFHDFRRGTPPGPDGPFPIFPRALKTSLPGLVKAGYRFASLEDTARYTEAHRWLEANCTTRYGRQYTWFGGTFVFALHEHHAAFIAEFSCAEGYKPMFAFEVRR